MTTLSSKEKKELKKTMQKIGSMGGKKTLKKHGKDHFRKLAKARWNKEIKPKK